MSNPNVSFTISASDKTQAAFASVGNGLGTLKSKSDSLFSAFSGGLAGGLATGLLGAGFTTAIKGAIDDLDKLDEAAGRLGVSVEDLSALNFAGKMNGLEFEDMTAALTKLSVKMQEAASGGKEAGALFNDLGVKVTDSSGKLKTADAVFAEIAETFSGLQDGAGKTALAVDAFGKSGAKLVPVLNGGAKGLADMRKEAESLGGIIDGKLAKQAADFNDNMDRLSVLSGTVAKSITGELLPVLNNLAERFLAARNAGMGFWESMPNADNSTRFKSAGKWINELTGDIDKLTASRNAAMKSNLTDGGSIDTSGMEAEIAKLTRRREYFKTLQRAEALEGSEGNYGNEGRVKSGLKEVVRTSTGSTTPKASKAAKETAEATAGAIAYGKAMESLAKLTGDAQASQLDLTKSQRALLDLMVAPQWADMPDTWKQTAVAQFEAAQAAETAADATKRLNDMLGETESAGIEKARSDMLLLVEALEKGTISEEKYIEAATARLGLNKKAADEAASEMDEFAKSAAKNLQSSLADFLFDPFANGTKSMADQFGQMLQRMAAEAAAAQIMKNLFGSMGASTGGASGGSGDWGWLGQAATWAASKFEDGGIMTKNGSVPLRKYAMGGIANAPQMAMFGEGSTPEAYVPLPDGRSIPVTMAGGGNSTTLNVYVASGTPSEVKRAAGAGARSALGAMGAAQRYA